MSQQPAKKPSRLQNTFFKIVKNIAVDAGIEIVRGYVVARLRPVTALDFYDAIKAGTHTVGVTDDKDKSFAKKWTPIMEKLSINGQKLQRDKLTATNVLEWLKTDRPDLAKVIISLKAEGMTWLTKDVELMFKFLFPESTPPQLTTRLGLVKICGSESNIKIDQPTVNKPQ